MDRNYLFYSRLQHWQIQFQIRVVSFDYMAHQLVERRGLPVPIGCGSSGGLIDLSKDLIWSESLRGTCFFERLLPSAAIVKAMLFQNSNRVQRCGCEVGQFYGGCHRFFSFVPLV